MRTSTTPDRDPGAPGLTRRQLLAGMTAVLGASPVLGGAGSFLFDSLTAEAATLPTLPAASPILVMIDLAGGNDILNTFIPMNVPTTTGYYRAARPGIGITQVVGTRPYGPPPAGNYLPPGLDLDGQWALHGALPWLANRWHVQQDVAIVQGVGENVMREMSHFAAFAYRWAGAFGGNLMNSGWLGRYNDLVNPNQPLGAVSLSGVNQALASMSSPSVSITDLSNFTFNIQNIPDATRWRTDLAAFADPASTAPNKAGVAANAINDAHLAMAAAKGVPQLGTGAAAGSLAKQLSTAASLILGGIPCQTYTATLGGFDTHGSEPWNHWDRLTDLNAALAGFFALIDGTPKASSVFVVLQSEFGRQVSQNAGQGTDHGQASCVIMIGGGVKGGLYGQFPDLAPAARDADAMVATVDFRSVYATVLNRLGGNPATTAAALGPDEANRPFADIGVFTTGPTALPPPPGSQGTTTTTAAGGTTTTTTRGSTATTMPVDSSTTIPMTSTTMSGSTVTTMGGTTSTTMRT